MIPDDRLRVYIGPRRKRKDGGHYPRWPYRFRLPGQKWVHGTGGFTEASTRQLVDKMIQEHLLRLKMAEHGIADASKVSVEKHVEDYLDWGRHEGGRGGLPWSLDHYVHRRAQLQAWIRILNLKGLSDIRFDKFAAVNTGRLAQGVAPNTVNHHAWALVAFVKWCHQRNRLSANSLAHFTSLDRRPRRERGAFDAAEFRALLAAASLSRQLLYRMAIFTGLRRTALASLRVRDVDWDAGYVTLQWEEAKNRKVSIKPLPGRLLADLRLYCTGKGPLSSLLDFRPRQAARGIHRDMLNAGLPILKDGRRRDFHSLKASLGTLLDDLGTLPEITQKALDHASFKQTQAYIKREIAPLRAAVEDLEHRLALSDTVHTHDGSKPEAQFTLGPEVEAASSSHSDSLPRLPRASLFRPLFSPSAPRPLVPAAV